MDSLDYYKSVMPKLFEKEAEEYAENIKDNSTTDNDWLSFDIAKSAYLEGAEFAYNTSKAELKEKYIKNITDCDICDTYCNSQLTKAKQIIRDFLSVAIDYIDKEDENYSYIEEGWQFLSEVK